MEKLNKCIIFFITFFLLAFSTSRLTFASDFQIHPEVSAKIFDKVKQNDNWKLAFLTAKDAQIVFMNITPNTNPKNEIGIEKHTFDQVIFVVEGNGKAILEGKETLVKAGDMIFIPQGVEHNVINLNAKAPLKILSIYSSMDIPANAIYKKKSDNLSVR